MLPGFLRKFFWDVDYKKIDPQRDYFFVLERLMEYGNDTAIGWVMSYYNDEQRLEVVRKSRRLSSKTARFWQNYYHLSEEDVRCLSEHYRQVENPFWNY